MQNLSSQCPHNSTTDVMIHGCCDYMNVQVGILTTKYCMTHDTFSVY